MASKLSRRSDVARVFICHRKTDDAPAERLASDLRAAGHHVWLDVWEIGVGDSILGEMNRGLEAADYVVLCLSTAGVDSPYASREWYSTLARQLRGERVTLLPAHLSGGKLPAILSDILPADLVNDWSQGVSRLLKAIGSRR
jgi:hypothetical protein